jgi:ribosomal protein S17
MTKQKNSGTSTKTKTTKPEKSGKTSYTVYDSKHGKTFSTLAEAKAYEKEYRARTGEFVSIVETKKKPTHKLVSFAAKNK